MSFDLFKFLFDKITEETDQYDTLTFPGMGEPLLDDALEEKIKYVKSSDKINDILILTNGSLLTPEKFSRLEQLGVTSIRISLYGYNSEQYIKAHGISNNSLFKELTNNLIAISELKKHTRLLLTYNIIDGINDSDLKSWINSWKDRADLLEVWKPHNWVTGKEYRSISKHRLKTCGRPFKGPLQVQVDGTVNMCCFDYDGQLTLGDLRTQSLEDIFNSSLYRKIRKCHTSGDFTGSNLICENCDQLNQDKSDIMVYSSTHDTSERIELLSTTYKKFS